MCFLTFLLACCELPGYPVAFDWPPTAKQSEETSRYHIYFFHTIVSFVLFCECTVLLNSRSIGPEFELCANGGQLRARARTSQASLCHWR